MYGKGHLTPSPLQFYRPAKLYADVKERKCQKCVSKEAWSKET